MALLEQHRGRRYDEAPQMLLKRRRRDKNQRSSKTMLGQGRQPKRAIKSTARKVGDWVASAKEGSCAKKDLFVRTILELSPAILVPDEMCFKMTLIRLSSAAQAEETAKGVVSDLCHNLDRLSEVTGKNKTKNQ